MGGGLRARPTAVLVPSQLLALPDYVDQPALVSGLRRPAVRVSSNRVRSPARGLIDKDISTRSGEDAEGEIRTPEGLAAHQISSLARWTELRYLSASPSSEVGNTFSRMLTGRTATARHRARTPSRVGTPTTLPSIPGLSFP